MSEYRVQVQVQDDGYLGECPNSVLDLTIGSGSTDALRLKLVVGNGPDHYRVYNVSKAASLTKDEHFREDFRTVVYVPGFNDRPGMLTSPRIVEAYQARGRHNVVLLDNALLLSLEYLRSARMTRYVGRRLGAVLAQMGVEESRLELVGFSLGAHVAGFAAKAYRKATGRSLKRITGLDPAGPCFRRAKPEDRLDRTDADYVQVLHTNGGELGLMSAIGHADFYANGGRRQPGPLGIFCLLACSHDRAVSLWSSAVVHQTHFVAKYCPSTDRLYKADCQDSKAVMGPAADPRLHGLFRLSTTANEPYFLAQDQEPPCDY